MYNVTFQIENLPVNGLEAAGLSSLLRTCCIDPLNRRLEEADAVIKEVDDLWERGFLSLEQRTTIREHITNQRNGWYEDKEAIERFKSTLRFVGADRSKISPFLLKTTPMPEEYTGEKLEALNKAVERAYSEHLRGADCYGVFIR